MCNRYSPAPWERLRELGIVPPGDYRPFIGPWGQGPFIRPVQGRARAFLGQWALIADGAKVARSPGRIMTNNARSEELEAKPTYCGPWRRGQRCLIPAASYDEPNWETGSNVWWRFMRRDGAPWALAGLWNDWTDPATGEVVASYTMLTINCDAHPLLSRMHRPDPARPRHMQDKRSVIPLEAHSWEAWLTAPVAEAKPLLQVPPLEVFDAMPLPKGVA